MKPTEVFERGATYRVKEGFESLRDSFDPSERLVYASHAQSIYDDKQGWFFYVVDGNGRVRAWDVDGVGDAPAVVPFEKIADVDALVRAAERGDAMEVASLCRDRSISDPFVHVAMDVAIDAGNGSAAAAIVASEKYPRDRWREALKSAARQGMLEVVIDLLDAGVPPYDEAIWSAVWFGATPIVELLIARGADPRKAGQSIATMLEFCERRSQPKIAEILERYR